MTDQRTDQGQYRGTPGAGAAAGPTASPPMPGPGAGWVRFAAVVMVIVGVFGVIEGLAALWSPTYFVTVGGTVLVLTLVAWAWAHLVLGVLVAVVGTSLLGAAPAWARGAAIALVALSAILHLAFAAAAPVWSIVVIALDVIVLYALIATWGEPLRAAR